MNDEHLCMSLLWPLWNIFE